MERKSRYTVAVKVADKFADTVSRATLKAFGSLPPEEVRTVTFDNGWELAGFKELERGGIRRFYHRRCGVILLGRTTTGNAASMRTPTACCGSFFRRVWISA